MWVILRSYVTTGEKIGFNCNRGGQRFQNLRAALELYALDGWPEASSLLRT